MTNTTESDLTKRAREVLAAIGSETADALSIVECARDGSIDGDMSETAERFPDLYRSTAFAECWDATPLCCEVARLIAEGE